MPPTLVAPAEPVISIQAAASDRQSASKPARSAPLPPFSQLILGADKRLAYAQPHGSLVAESGIFHDRRRGRKFDQPD